MGKLPYEIPDWSKYKVKDVPELKEIQDRLARKGLKDPWLRNEVWRYQPHMRGVPLLKILFKGFKWGTAAFIVAVGIEKFFMKDDAHGHGDAHH